MRCRCRAVPALTETRVLWRCGRRERSGLSSEWRRSKWDDSDCVFAGTGCFGTVHVDTRKRICTVTGKDHESNFKPRPKPARQSADWIRLTSSSDLASSISDLSEPSPTHFHLLHFCSSLSNAENLFAFLAARPRHAFVAALCSGLQRICTSCATWADVVGGSSNAGVQNAGAYRTVAAAVPSQRSMYGCSERRSLTTVSITKSSRRGADSSGKERSAGGDVPHDNDACAAVHRGRCMGQGADKRQLLHTGVGVAQSDEGRGRATGG